ncbi:Inactive rhomboid protein 1 [Echinococcus granulosus]|uniref:Inactive rhomboid protein 1 n=1 Tax=Echinococcus granulosus TaxID=6210 RepID=A0A068WR71_ECHGR|nr:Inactive rhomboid protein 1 [Echinococcus granulosus]CDS22638.1 inactive rhomboid protein 1 [Echinococcus granulosus]
MSTYEEVSKRTSFFCDSVIPQAASPDSLKNRAVDLLVHGFINANEDWNSRRLRYNLKKYGNIKAEKLGKSCNDFSISHSQPDSLLRSSLRRQVDLMTHLGTPTPFSPSGVSAYRNSALRTLSNLFMDTAVRRRRNHDRSNGGLVLHRMSGFEPTVLKLPAGTIVSSPLSNEILMSDTTWRASHAAPEHHDRNLEVLNNQESQRTPLSHGTALRSAPVKGGATSRDFRSHSCIELHSYSLKTLSRGPLDLPVSGRRIFFPSTSTSQLSKTPDQTDGFGDMLVDFAVKQTHKSKDVAALDAQIASHLETKISGVSAAPRLSMVRPPPLNLGPTLAFTESRGTDYGANLDVRGSSSSPDNQSSHPLKHPSAKHAGPDAGTPYIIRPRVHRGENSSTPMSPLTPLILLKPDHHNSSKLLGRYRQSEPFRFLSHFFRRSKPTDEIYRQVDDSMLDYRPYFTYMLCFIHLLVMIFACVGYGFAPIGINLERTVNKQVMMPSLDIENVCRVQDENIWIGPQQADLIRMGALFSPCMRVDDTLNRVVVEAQKNWDRRSGCCVNMRDGTCYQSSRLFCSRSTSTWLHYSDNHDLLVAEALLDPQMESLTSQSDFANFGSTTRPSIGPVCGLDPEFCAEPRSTGPFTWSSTDVTEWPICAHPVNTSSLAGFAPHMECEVVARPCCVGLKGECIITTPVHCTFLQGHYHSEAHLCSQVRCLQEVCGMIPFVIPSTPDQLSRLFVSLFLHAGILHLALSLFIQLTVMRHLEKLLGCVRIATVFILSGCFSGLASGIMLPYHVHMGPTGAHFALFGVSLMDSLQTIDIFVSPWSVILKQVVLVVFGVFIGFLPWLDNHAHISGFVSGVLLSYVFVPYLGYGNKNQLTMMRVANLRNQTIAGDSDHEIYQHKLEELLFHMRRRKLKVIMTCMVTWLLLFVLLLVVFIKWPLTNCTWCKYFNCLPWTPTLCDTLEVNVHAPARCINPRT